MPTLTWITEKELEREIKTKGDQYRWTKKAAVRKRGNASCSCLQGENKRRRKKKVNRNTQASGIFSL